MKYCTHCGNPVDDNAKFCVACGQPIEERETEPELDFFDDARESESTDFLPMSIHP